jgi:threonylcarbamoyladenosine tRNA methylthiotransferase MtaB
MPRISFKTLGCRLNQAETAQLAAAFAAQGCTVVPFGAACDVCLIHTCTVTRTAERKSIRYARYARRLPGNPRVLVAGCAVQRDAEGIRRATGADVVAGQKEKWDLPHSKGLASPPSADIPSPGGVALAYAGAGVGSPSCSRTRALVKVQDGCDFKCAYCIVPYTRGAPVSRAPDVIVDNVAALARAGYREVVLTGANLGCYAAGGMTLPGLVEAVAAQDDIARVRLSSIEVSTVEREIVDVMRRTPAVCRMLHLPLQSGDGGILKAMGRRYTPDAYRAIVEYAVERLPCLGLGTDVLVGFPGEDAAAFRNTLRMLDALPFSNLHVFAYSSRPGTAAERLVDDVPAEEKRRRAAEVRALGERKRQAFVRRMAGQEVDVLVECVDADGTAHGWTGEYVRAAVRGGACAVNTIVRGRMKPTDPPRRLRSGATPPEEGIVAL